MYFGKLLLRIGVFIVRIISTILAGIVA